VFATAPTPGVASPAGDDKDPRSEPYGPLPADWGRWRGLYLHGDQVVLRYSVNGVELHELPGLEGPGTISRTISIGERNKTLTLVIAEFPGGTGGVGPVGDTLGSEAHGDAGRSMAGLVGTIPGKPPGKDGKGGVPETPYLLGVGLIGAPDGATWKVQDARIKLTLPPGKAALCKLVLHSPEAGDSLSGLAPFLKPAGALTDPLSLTKGGPARWAETITTQGTMGADSGSAYVVDTVTSPEKNPWKAGTRWGGFDFFADGKRAALSTWDGDVWIVSGLAAQFGQFTWKRYATGLFHGLGLKIVDDVVYVHGRDQITRLKDLDGDGEADYYENFFNGIHVTPNFHEFAYELQTDAAGNFYFIKGGPVRPGGRGFDTISEHHGCLFKLSKDGSTLEVIATGFRAPNGIGVGPDGTITTGDNEGSWTPKCRLNWIQPGGFYGVPPLSHRTPPPTDFAKPVLWFPKNISNSDGGQGWVIGGKWGPLDGHLLHSSYGTCMIFNVMHEVIDGTRQGAVVRIPVKLDSGTMRLRFHPQDGQLYACGLKGWQTTAALQGAFQRVRYTGKPAFLAKDLAVKKDGFEITFTDPLDPAGTQADSFSVSIWNYKWTEAYGCEDFKVSDGSKGRDMVAVTEATLSQDNRTLRLTVPELQPCWNYVITAKLAFPGVAKPIDQEIYGTIYNLGK
jgi:hypothetical protein